MLGSRVALKSCALVNVAVKSQMKSYCSPCSPWLQWQLERSLCRLVKLLRELANPGPPTVR